MARCQRCYACESQWDFSACKHCGYPGADTRTPEQIKKDDEWIAQLEADEELDYIDEKYGEEYQRVFNGENKG